MLFKLVENHKLRTTYFFKLEDSQSHKIRLAAFEWLQEKSLLNENVFDWKDLSKGFQYQNHVIPLIGAKGIWKPKLIQKYPISITSTVKSIYSDKFISEDLLYYSYRGENPRHSDNVGLREAGNDKIPLIYFHQITKGKYFAVWPVFVVGDEPQNLKFLISADSSEVLVDESILNEPTAEYRRKYKTREVLVRLHQQSFRERVLMAYREHCAMCNLKHRSLLDAAHILEDSQGGNPEVSNGLSLCKIHHAAFDQNIIGINPDYRIEVREDILHEIDGPMLKYGIQKMNNQKLILPRSTRNQPNKELLDFRYQRFKRVI